MMIFFFQNIIRLYQSHYLFLITLNERINLQLFYFHNFIFVGLNSLSFTYAKEWTLFPPQRFVMFFIKLNQGFYLWYSWICFIFAMKMFLTVLIDATLDASHEVKLTSIWGFEVLSLFLFLVNFRLQEESKINDSLLTVREPGGKGPYRLLIL